MENLSKTSTLFDDQKSLATRTDSLTFTELSRQESIVSLGNQNKAVMVKSISHFNSHKDVNVDIFGSDSKDGAPHDENI